MNYETPDKETSYRMRRIKSKGTKLEKRMEELLIDLGISYEKQIEIVGHPDFKIKDTNLLIFCDSSFWHGRREKEVTGKAFSKNKEFWTKKLMYNKERDKRINRKLRREGWSVHRFWDTDIIKKPEKVKKRLSRIFKDI